MSESSRQSATELGLNADEVHLLRMGLAWWGGPARPTDELALAMGFTDRASLPQDCRLLKDALVRAESLDPLDWARALLATEVSFSSDVLGVGYEWSTVVGWSDERTVRTLRSVQRKLVRTVAPVVGNGLGTRIEQR